MMDLIINKKEIENHLNCAISATSLLSLPYTSTNVMAFPPSGYLRSPRTS